MKRVVVIGGGISGLACARAIAEEAKAKDERVEITVLESSARFGGNVSTEREGEFVLDGGPDSWVTNKPEATALAKSLGLEDQFLSTKTENRKVCRAAPPSRTTRAARVRWRRAARRPACRRRRGAPRTRPARSH